VVAFKQISDAYTFGRCLENRVQQGTAFSFELSVSGIIKMSHEEKDLKSVRIQRWDNEEDLLYYCHTSGFGVVLCSAMIKHKSGWLLAHSCREPVPDRWNAVYYNHLYNL